MSLLAEGKRKVKYGLDPQNTKWSNDESKFGQRLMEKMGWEKGKGLGASENGMTEHIKASYKWDQRGLGATTENTDAWVAHQDDFNDLLQKLNAGKEGESSTDNTKTMDGQKRYYGRFSRGRVQKLRTTEDLDCIFGRRKPNSEPTTPSNISAANSGDESSDKDTKCEAGENKIDGTFEKSHGLTTVTSTCSVQEYFAQKMREMKARREAGGSSSVSGTSGTVDIAIKEEKEDIKQAPPVYGRVAFSYDDNSDETGEWQNLVAQGAAVEDGNEDLNTSKKKKKKKKKHCDDENVTTSCEMVPIKVEVASSDVDGSADKTEAQRKEKKKKRKVADDVEEVDERVSKKMQKVEDGSINTEENDEDKSCKGKKEKKKKKSKADNDIDVMEEGIKQETVIKEEMKHENVMEESSNLLDGNVESKKKTKKSKKRSKSDADVEETLGKDDEGGRVGNNQIESNQEMKNESHMTSETQEAESDDLSGAKKNKNKKKKKKDICPSVEPPVPKKSMFPGSNFEDINGYANADKVTTDDLGKEGSKKKQKEEKKKVKKSKKQKNRKLRAFEISTEVKSIAKTLTGSR